MTVFYQEENLCSIYLGISCSFPIWTVALLCIIIICYNDNNYSTSQRQLSIYCVPNTVLPRPHDKQRYHYFVSFYRKDTEAQRVRGVCPRRFLASNWQSLDLKASPPLLWVLLHFPPLHCGCIYNWWQPLNYIRNSPRQSDKSQFNLANVEQLPTMFRVLH